MLKTDATIKKIISVPLALAIISSSGVLPAIGRSSDAGFAIVASADSDSAAEAVMTGASLSLEGDIVINFVIEAPEGAFDSIEFSGEGMPLRTVTAANAKLTDGTYKASCPVCPKDYSKPVTMKLKKGGENVDFSCSGAKVSSFSYSVKDYIDYQLTTNEASLSTELKVLIQSLRDYCELADIYFNQKDAKEHFSSVDAMLPRLEKYKMTVKDSSGAEVTDLSTCNLKGASLLIDDMTSFRLYFTQEPTSTTIGNGKVMSKTVGDETLYYVEQKNIGANHLSDMQNDKTVTFGENTYTVSYCALSYVERAMEKRGTLDSALLDVVRALYSYSFAADMYSEAAGLTGATITGIDLTYDAGKYTFTYQGNVYTATYSSDNGGNWHIDNSYQINNRADMAVICEALQKEHPVNGCLTEYRTAMDMAIEWELHNNGYSMVTGVLNSGLYKWAGYSEETLKGYQNRLAHVDLDTADQGFNMNEFLSKKLGMSSDMIKLIELFL